MPEQLVEPPDPLVAPDDAGAPGRPAAIPTLELISLNFTTLRAFRCGRSGSEQAGHRILLNGLEKVRATWSGREPWLRELERRWQRALDEYRRRYAGCR